MFKMEESKINITKKERLVKLNEIIWSFLGS